MGGVTSIGFGCFGTNTILDSEANRILKNHTEGVPDWKTLVEKKKTNKRISKKFATILFHI